MIKKLIMAACAALLLAGCFYATTFKDVAFILQYAVERTEMVTGDDIPKDGAIVLKCDSFSVATCPDRLLELDSLTSRITQPALIHSSVLRRMSSDYGFPLHNLPDDFTGCVLANVTHKRRTKTLASAEEIDDDDARLSIVRANARHLLPIRRCWSDVYAPTGFRYAEMREHVRGSKILKMKNINWENEDVLY